MTTAVVVDSGPNGLAAAVARTEELTVPGVLHDVCSAVHPLGVASPFLQSRYLRSVT